MKSSPATHLEYRSEIDGLRAIAVISVVLYHAGVKWIGGGFVGVDIFFVISGYLITGLISDQIDQGTFSLLDFYERRVRRIIPALFFIMAVCAVAAVCIFLPSDLKRFAGDLIATILFVSNFRFWSETAYFAPPAELSPLLHTWSLAIEEQFYVVFPLALVAAGRFSRGVSIATVALLLALSLALCFHYSRVAPVAAFYLTPTRAWELMLGALLGLRALPIIKSQLLIEAVFVAGLIFVVYAIFAFSSDMTFPGTNALLPTGGTALVIYSNQEKKARSVVLLTSEPLVAIGLISYSLYLWHWPLLVFSRYILQRPLSSWEIVLLCLVSTIAAAISQRYIEQPFRKRDGFWRRDRLFFTVGVFAVLLIGFGFFVLAVGGIPSRFSTNVRVMDSYLSHPPTSGYRTHTCFISDKTSIYDRRDCFAVDPKRENVLLWGDSHAAHLGYGLRIIAKIDGVNLLQATQGNCPPSVGGHERFWQCTVANRAFAKLIVENRVDATILSANWSGSDFDQKDLENTIRFLREATRGPIFVIGPGPTFTDRLPAILARRLAYTGDIHIDSTRYADDTAFRRDREMKVEFGTQKRVQYISLLDRLCPARACPIVGARGGPIVWDVSHLTDEGSELVARSAFGPILAQVARQNDAKRPSTLR